MTDLAAAPTAPAPARAATRPSTALAGSDLQALRAAIDGRVLVAGDPGYDAARGVHNTSYDRAPAAIVRPENAVDVSRAVTTARAIGLEIAVKGGGHSVAGHSTTEGGLLIDMGSMHAVEIDPVRRIGTAQGGATAGQYTLAAQAHGLATPFGDTLSVGLGGLTLGGGIGWLARRYGMTIDSLLEVDLVTADGQLVTVSEASDPDLFWAVRGGGGNFGVATRFRYRLHDVGTIVGGAIALPLRSDVLRNLVEVSLAAPESVTQISAVMPLPPAPFVPAELVGTPAVIVLPVAVGDPAEAAAALAPFRSIATPLVELVASMPYPGIYQFTAGAEEPGPSVVRSSFLPGLDEAAADAIVARHTDPDGASSMTQLRVFGGAMGRVPADATAFAHRTSPVMFGLITPVTGTPEDAIAWTQAYFEELAGSSTGVYSNFLADEGAVRLREAYPGTAYERLVGVKRRVDPDNAFRGNHNIRPG